LFVFADIVRQAGDAGPIAREHTASCQGRIIPGV